ncbi:RNA polymerase subunit sigma [Actinophytocola xinjiangensis]|uniref:RNA polymerase subunit sigma n=1 Tax=Actinophytocola xinjiangensis TaxID=485602 RepID=A0A7Z0WPD8_9PSEU|nr:sigma-70 family RNA polymerase sigma factor [Actinophytocola xinjiangensis]OLF11499.1 RNA polymerase subunit sigma [Actinophytocola xinjiangensis]
MDEHDLAGIGQDPDLFEVFYREHLERVQRFVARRVADPHLVADLTAEVFLAVVRSADTYRPDRGSVVGWLYGVAHNVVAAERRRRAREHLANERAAGRRDLTDEDLALLDDRIDAESRARELGAAMDELTFVERSVLALVALDGLTVKDAALALGVTQVAARVRLHRAKRVLRDRLTPTTPTLEVTL